jgi:hypothetical protein
VKKNVEFQRGIVEHDLRERKVQLISTTEWKKRKLGRVLRKEFPFPVALLVENLYFLV